MNEVSLYYRQHFPHSELCNLLQRSWSGKNCLATRELCIETQSGHYNRFLQVESAEQLKELFLKKGVEKFHTGAVYDVRPSLRWKNVQLKVQQRELVFDIDLDDYGVNKNDILECDRNWQLVAFGFTLIRHCLTFHFGFENLLLVYSGRRGAHLTVYDARACALTDERRRAIVSWLQPAKQKGDKPKGYRRIIKSPGFGNLYDNFVLPFWKNCCIKARSKGGFGMLDSPICKDLFMETFGSNYAKKNLSLCGMDGEAAWEELLRFAEESKYRDETTIALKEAVLEFVWPKLDSNVTALTAHLSKCVMSVHPNTGRICMPVIGDALGFRPDKCATFSDVVANDSAALEQVHRATLYLKKFTRRLSKSTTETWIPPKLDIQLPTTYDMTRKKRSREARNETFACVDRVCSSATRVFSALSLDSDPNKVAIYFHTEICSEGVHVVPAGYSLPWREGEFPIQSFSEAMARARRHPGQETTCCRSFLLILFGDTRKRVGECAQRLNKMHEGLLRPMQLCTVDTTWDNDAITSMIKAQVKDMWCVTQVNLE
jgi:DNA primase small subunit